QFWASADVEVEGNSQLQQAVRFGLFHVLQAGARAERRGIAAKGLTGPGNDGHAFWHTETFVLPMLSHTMPDAPADSASPVRRFPGAPSMARNARGTGRPVPRPSTSTPTSPTRRATM